MLRRKDHGIHPRNLQSLGTVGGVRAGVVFVCLSVAAAVLAWPTSGRAADTSQCAPTAADPQPRTPTADAPCWVEVTPYPFGDEGAPVDTSEHRCLPSGAADSRCYL